MLHNIYKTIKLFKIALKLTPLLFPGRNHIGCFANTEEFIELSSPVELHCFILTLIQQFQFTSKVQEYFFLIDL